MKVLNRYEDFNLKERAKYFEKINFGSHRDEYIASIHKILPDLISEEIIILIPQRIPLDQKYDDEFLNALFVFGWSIFIPFFMILFSSTNNLELKKYLK